MSVKIDAGVFYRFFFLKKEPVWIVKTKLIQLQSHYLKLRGLLLCCALIVRLRLAVRNFKHFTELATFVPLEGF